MGASVGVLLDKLNPELREAVELVQKQKSTIAEYDSALLDRETSKVFKKHGKIVETLTSRTKAQLKRTIVQKGRVPDDIYKIVGGNNNYALFMKQLHMSKQEIEMENLKNSSKTELYDEEMLINIIGTSSNKELKLFSEMYAKEKGTDLWDVFTTKLKPDSQLQKFLKLCCKCDRDETKNSDSLLAAEQAAEIHKAGAARLIGCDDDLIFKILVRSSRAQCAAIADSYLMQFHIKFERAINMKFKGNCSKLLLLYVLPLPAAIISCIHTYEDRLLIDKVAIISMVSKYDKDTLAQVDIAAEKMFEKSLFGIVQRGLSGNLFNAVQGWIENPSPDKGYERVTEVFIESQLIFGPQGRTIEDLLKREDFQQRLLFLTNKEQEELQTFMHVNRIKFNPTDKLDLRAISTMDSFDAHHSLDAAKLPDVKEVLNKYSMKEPAERAGTDYETKYVALQKYFKSYFTIFDTNSAGSFAEEEFWEIMKKLPLEKLGLNDAEVEQMSTWCEWVQEGRIHYHEAVFELADSMITSIEGKCEGETDVMKVVEELSKLQVLKKAPSEPKVGRHGSVAQLTAVPDYFMQYLYDTFFAYDFDNNGFLCQSELNTVLPVLNMGMTWSDFIPDVKAKISHKNAVQIIARKVQPWFLDNDHDNYICLVDKDSGLFFWFNCKDESSQWADTEGEGWAGYGSRRASTMNPDMVFSNALAPSKSGLSRVPSAGSSPPGSPRAPTRADEKETEEASKSEAAASAEPKKRGIADQEEESGSSKESAADSKEDVASVTISVKKEKSQSKLDDATASTSDDASEEVKVQSPGKSTKSGRFTDEADAKAESKAEDSTDSAAEASVNSVAAEANQEASTESKTMSAKEGSSPATSPARPPSTKVASAVSSPSKKSGTSSKADHSAANSPSKKNGMSSKEKHSDEAHLSPRSSEQSNKEKIASGQSGKFTAEATEETKDASSPTATSTKDNAAE